MRSGRYSRPPAPRSRRITGQTEDEVKAKFGKEIEALTVAVGDPVEEAPAAKK